jgi:hypothetical protein
MRNPQAFWAIVTALLSLAALAGAALAGRMFSDVVGLYEAMPAVPVAFALALVSMALARRARAIYKRSLGRAGHPVVVGFARVLAAIALIVAVTAALSLAVFAVLTLALD